jgi:hypothetical protein
MTEAASRQLMKESGVKIRLLWKSAVITSLIAVAGCSNAGPSQEKLVGAWICPRSVVIPHALSEDEAITAALKRPGNTVLTVFKTDHSCVESLLGKAPSAAGGGGSREQISFVGCVHVDDTCP